MPVYKLTADGKAKLKKTWTFTLLASYIVMVGIFAFNLLYRGGDTRDIIIFSVILVALIAGYIYGRNKYFKGIDATKLVVDDEKILLHTLNQPDIEIYFTDIMKVTHRGQGIFLVNRSPKKKSLFIINKFEDFYEIERLVNDKVHENSLHIIS
jgi:hypothetical protein